MNDTQLSLDNEIAADFRRLTTRLHGDIRRHRIAEAKLKKVAKDRQREHRRKEALLERRVDEFDGDNLAFVHEMQRLQHEAEEAQLALSEAINAYREERLNRKQALLKLFVAIKQFNAPLPLFDRREETPAEAPAETVKPKRGKKRKETV